MPTITVGQMQQLTDRLANIIGAESPQELKRKRLDQLQRDVAHRFNIASDEIAHQFLLNIAEYWLELGAV